MEGAQRLATPLVGCAQATIGRPPSGGAPAGYDNNAGDGDRLAVQFS